MLSVIMMRYVGRPDNFHVLDSITKSFYHSIKKNAYNTFQYTMEKRK